MRFLALIAVLIILSACTTVPEQIQGTYSDISPARVEPSVFGTDVRWGGVIVGSQAKENKTCLEILSRDLDKYLRPKTTDSTAGRFLACQPGFLDPMVFSSGREITVTGDIKAIEVRKVEDFDYRYPVVEVDDLVLWQKRRVVMRYRGFSDPFYAPFYGPYYGRRGYWGGWGGYGYGYGFGGYWGPTYRTGYAEPVVLLPGPAIIETRD